MSMDPPKGRPIPSSSFDWPDMIPELFLTSDPTSLGSPSGIDSFPEIAPEPGPFAQPAKSSTWLPHGVKRRKADSASRGPARSPPWGLSLRFSSWAATLEHLRAVAHKAIRSLGQSDR
jgi:hypothetical protein